MWSSFFFCELLFLLAFFLNVFKIHTHFFEVEERCDRVDG
jgi:hypothetical protein